MATVFESQSPSGGLVQAMAAGDGAALLETERGLNADLIGRGLSTELAARIAHGFVEDFLSGVAKHQAPEQAMAQARHAMTIQVEHLLATPPEPATPLLETLAQGGDAHWALDRAGPLAPDAALAAERALLHGLDGETRDTGSALGRVDAFAHTSHALEQAGVGPVSESARLLSALASGGTSGGENFADLLHGLKGSGIGDSAAFQQELLGALGRGVSPFQALDSAKGVATLASQASDAGIGTSSAESRMLDAVASGGAEAASALAAESGLSQASDVEHMIESLEAGRSLEGAVADAANAHDSSVDLLAASAAEPAQGNDTLMALAAGEGVGDALSSAGADHFVDALAAGHSPEAAFAEAQAAAQTEAQVSRDLEHAATVDGHSDPIAQAMATGEGVSEALGMAGDGSPAGHDAFVAILTDALAQGLAPDIAAQAAHDGATTAEGLAEAGALPATQETQQALALAGGDSGEAPPSTIPVAGADADGTSGDHMPAESHGDDHAATGAEHQTADASGESLPTEAPSTETHDGSHGESLDATMPTPDPGINFQNELMEAWFAEDNTLKETDPLTEGPEQIAESPADTEWVNDTKERGNLAPDLAGGLVLHLAPIDNSDSNPPSTRIAELIPSGAIFDPDDGALASIAVIAANNGTGDKDLGYWQFKIPDGSDWTTIDPASFDHDKALLLDGNDLIRFMPTHSTAEGSASLTFVGWDETSGSHGHLTDAATRGGNSAFSETTGTVIEDIHHHTDA